MEVDIVENAETSMEESELNFPKIVFENTNIGLKNSKKAHHLMTDERFCRITLKVGQEGREILANPNLLTLSPFFNQKLTEENHERTIELVKMDPNAVESIVYYLHTGILEITEKTVKNLLLTSEKLLLLEITERCVEFLVEQLNPGNCVKYRDFASLNGFSYLLEECNRFINKNFTNLADHGSFLELTYTDLQNMIATCSREITTNEAIFKAIIRWGEHKENDRESFLPGLVQNFDLDELFDYSPEIIRAAFAENTILGRNPQCSKMYYKMCEAKAFQNSILLKRRRKEVEITNPPSDQNQLARSDPQQYLKKEKASTSLSFLTIPPTTKWNDGNDKSIPKIPEQETFENSLQVQELNDKNEDIEQIIINPLNLPLDNLRSLPAVSTTSSTSDSSIPITDLEKTRIIKRPRLIQMDEPEIQILPNYVIMNKMLIYPRFVNKKKFLNGYNFQFKATRTFHEVRPSRRLSSLIYSQNKIYDIGGTSEQKYASEDDDSSLASRSVDIFTMGFTFVGEKSKLIEARKEFAACVCRNNIYVIGGFQGVEAINCAERFALGKTTKTKWESVEFMEFPRGAHDVVVLENKIYAIGGIGQIEHRGGAVDLPTVVRYDPGKNNWETMPQMNEARGFLKTAVINNLVYAVGGNILEIGFVNRRSLNTVEIYNPEKATWNLCTPMNHCRSRGMVMAHNDLLYAIGGNSKTNPSIEVYDPRIEKWILLDWPVDLNKEADFFSAIAFDN